MPPERFEPAIPASDGPQAFPSELSATGIDSQFKHRNTEMILDEEYGS